MGKLTSKRVALLGDSHFPFANVLTIKEAIYQVKQSRPTAIYMLGDMVDLDAYSRFLSDINGHTIKSELDQLTWFISKLTAITPNTHMLEGNHEFRAKKVAWKDPRGLIADIAEVVREYDVTWYPHNAVVPVGNKWVVAHGLDNKSGSGSSAINAVKKLNCSVAVGHCHRASTIHETVGVYPNIRTFTGVEIGCLCYPSCWYDGINSMSFKNWQTSWTLLEDMNNDYQVRHFMLDSGKHPSNRMRGASEE